MDALIGLFSALLIASMSSKKHEVVVDEETLRMVLKTLREEREKQKNGNAL